MSGGEALSYLDTLPDAWLRRTAPVTVSEGKALG